ncbi:MAG: glycosyltransferase family 39 protein [Cyanobacteria bacterium P01_D01_bin.36]
MENSVLRTSNAHENTALESDLAEKTLWQNLSLLLLGLMAFTMLFWRLGAESLNDWDEAIYAQVAKEIVNSGDWLTLHWGYEVWFHKPPLFMWVTATFFKLFEVNEFWARVPSALSGFGLVGCTYLIACKLYKKKEGQSVAHRIGLLSAAVLLTNYTFVHFSRFGTTDIALTLSSYLAIYAYLWVCEERCWAWCGVWSAIAAAVMIKGVAGLAIAIVLFMTLLLTNHWRQAICCIPFWIGFGIASMVVIPWHAAMLVMHGQAFVDQYLLYHVVERSTGGGLEGNEGGPFFYVASLGEYFFPWVYLLPLAMFQQVRNLWQKGGSVGAVLLVLVAIVFGGFSLASTKLHWYIIPMYPAMAIWVGALLYQALTCKDRLMWLGLLFSGTAVMALFPAEIVFLPDVLRQSLVVVGVVVLMMLSVAVFEFGWRRQVLSVALCGLFVIAGMREIKGIYHGGARPVARLSQAAEVPAAVGENAQKPPALVVAMLSERLYMPTALFYSNRPIDWVRSPQALAAATSTTHKRDILLATADIQMLQPQYDIDIYARDGALIYAGIQQRS